MFTNLFANNNAPKTVYDKIRDHYSFLSRQFATNKKNIAEELAEFESLVKREEQGEFKEINTILEGFRQRLIKSETKIPRGAVIELFAKGSKVVLEELCLTDQWTFVGLCYTSKSLRINVCDVETVLPEYDSIELISSVFEITVYKYCRYMVMDYIEELTRELENIPTGEICITSRGASLKSYNVCYEKSLRETKKYAAMKIRMLATKAEVFAKFLDG